MSQKPLDVYIYNPRDSETETPFWTKMTEEFGIFWGDELYNYSAFKEPIIEHMLYKNDVICISSEAGVGKSILALQLIFSLTSGDSFLDTYKVYKPCNVLYLQTEGDRSETIERINNMKKGLRIDDSRLVHINLEGVMLNIDERMNEFIELAKIPNINYDVIFIDPVYTTVKGSMIKDEVATDWVRNIRRLKGIFQASVVAIHHDNKDVYFDGQIVKKSNKNIFGSVFWGAFFNHNFKFKTVGGIHYLQLGKQRSGKVTDIVEMKLVEPEPLMFVNNDEHLDLSTTKVVSVLKLAGIKLPPMEIKKKIDMSRATTYRALARLVDSERIERIEEGNKVFYSLKNGGLNEPT